MMNSMRKHTKTILWIVVIAFVGTIFFVWGMDAGRQKTAIDQISAAVVNDEPISYTDFAQHWEQRYRQIVANSNEEPAPKEIQRMRNELMDSLIDAALLRQQFDKLKLTVTADEVAARIYSIRAFHENGVFSQEKYLSMLGYNRITPESFEAEQANTIKLMKMSRILSESAVVTEESIKQYFLTRSRQIKLKWVRFQWEDYLNKVTITPSEVKAYFNKNRSDYDQPEEVEASHILLRLDGNATEEEKLTIKLKMDTIRTDIVNGADFSKMAEEHSDDPGSKEKGGKLGYFRRGVMVGKFEDAAFALKAGELSDIVETPFGFHLIKTTGHRAAKKADLNDVQNEIKKILQEEKARKQSQQAAMTFLLAVEKADSLSLAAKDSGLKTTLSPWVKEDGTIKGIEGADQLINAALDLPLNKPSASLTVGQTIYFVETVNEKPQPFNEELYTLEHDSLLEQLKRIRGNQLTTDWLKQAHAEATIVNNVAKEADQQSQDDSSEENADTTTEVETQE